MTTICLGPSNMNRLLEPNASRVRSGKCVHCPALNREGVRGSKNRMQNCMQENVGNLFPASETAKCAAVVG